MATHKVELVVTIGYEVDPDSEGYQPSTGPKLTPLECVQNDATLVDEGAIPVGELMATAAYTKVEGRVLE